MENAKTCVLYPTNKMKEALLQYIWKFQLYDNLSLKTVQDETVQIIYQGDYNATSSGPDFTNATIVVNGIKLFGTIEIHVFASDWIKHQHQKDKNYQSVILHVVYFNDVKPINNLPTLILNGKIAPLLLQKYQTIFSDNNVIKCKNLASTLEPITIRLAKENAIIHRLERKYEEIIKETERFNGDWNQVYYQKMMQCFFDKTNQYAVKLLIQQLPYLVLLKHADSVFQLEALFFGVAGFLESNFTDNYPNQLKKEFTFLKAKYQLKPIRKKLWNFFRIRPMAFPTIRLAQLANLFHTTPQFVRLYQLNKVKETLQFIRASNYWQTHFILDKATTQYSTNLGKKQIDKLIINYTLPLQYAFARFKNDNLEYILEYYQNLQKEKNCKTNLFEYNHFQHRTAYDSQAFIELYDEFCTKQKCLQCIIGHKVLSQTNKINQYLEEEVPTYCKID